MMLINIYANTLVKMIIKYVFISFDVNNGILMERSTLFKNTKVYNFKIDVDKHRWYKRNIIHSQGRAIIQMEMVHDILNI